jgi:hypothetical protein
MASNTSAGTTGMLRTLKLYRREHRNFQRETGGRVPVPHLLRHFGTWSQKKSEDCRPVEDRIPWMTFEAIRFLDHYVTSESRVFEWGMGGSTLFFLDRTPNVVSVDHDPVWFDRLEKMLAGHNHWNGYHHSPIKLETSEPTDPTDCNLYGSSNPDFRYHSFENYVRVIDHYDDASFDVTVVDGRARPACTKHAISKLRTGGIMVLDNAERPQYHQIHELLSDATRWQRIDCGGPAPYAKHFWSTVIWKKLGPSNK